MIADKELIVLGEMLIEAADIAQMRIDALAEDLALEDEIAAIDTAIAVPQALARAITSLPATSEVGWSAKVKAHAWLEGCIGRKGWPS